EEMDLKIIIFDSESYTDYSFENELKKKVDYKVLLFNSEKTRVRIGFRKKDMRMLNVTVEGKDIDDPDEFNNTIARAINKTTENLSIALYGVE
ncbi:hypothetical protein JUJ52_20985, partial [Virgibacillus sp. AGTR]|uniref:hypothetical protein n=1 Tax=Virgibacillus sp. AGTR TaxID=2812055 RepID=UPI001D15F0D7